jgi:hypothetical protein
VADTARSDTGQVLARAFPEALATAAAAAAQIIPVASHLSSGEFVVGVGGQDLFIPYRIYNDEPEAQFVDSLSPAERRLLRAFFTRHHDGHVRQRNLELIVSCSERWIAAYVVQLVGEYVVRVIESAARGLSSLSIPGSDQRDAYGQFAAENAAFLDLTAARVVSYWNEYYRHRYLKISDYPGQILIDQLRSAAEDYNYKHR